MGWYREKAAEIFALVVFVCDGLLEIKEENTSRAAKFLRMSKELTMELQLVLSHRVVGSGAQNIPGPQREQAFKELTRKLLQ